MRGSVSTCGSDRRVPDTRLDPYAVTAKIGEGDGRGACSCHECTRDSQHSKDGDKPVNLDTYDTGRA